MATERTQVVFSLDSIPSPRSPLPKVAIPFGKFFSEKKLLIQYLKEHQAQKIEALEWRFGHVVVTCKNENSKKDLVGLSFKISDRELKFVPFPFIEKFEVVKFALRGTDPSVPTAFYGNLLASLGAPIINLRQSQIPDAWKEDSILFEVPKGESQKIPNRIILKCQNEEQIVLPIKPIATKYPIRIPKEEIAGRTFSHSNEFQNPKSFERSRYRPRANTEGDEGDDADLESEIALTAENSTNGKGNQEGNQNRNQNGNQNGNQNENQGENQGENRERNQNAQGNQNGNRENQKGDQEEEEDLQRNTGPVVMIPIETPKKQGARSASELSPPTRSEGGAPNEKKSRGNEVNSRDIAHKYDQQRRKEKEKEKEKGKGGSNDKNREKGASSGNRSGSF